MAKTTIVNRVEGVVPAGETTLTLAMKGLSSNLLVCYDRIAGVDHTSNPTSLTFGFIAGAEEVLLEGFSSPGAGITKAVKGKVFAPGHYRPFVRVVGATAGDKIGLYIYGYITDMPE